MNRRVRTTVVERDIEPVAMYKKLTSEAAAVIKWARHEAGSRRHPAVDVQDIASAVFEILTPTLEIALTGILGLDLVGFHETSLRGLRMRILAASNLGPDGRMELPPGFTEEATDVLARAHEEATAMGRQEVGPEHLLLGLIGTGESVFGSHHVAQVLPLAETRDAIKAAYRQIRCSSTRESWAGFEVPCGVECPADQHATAPSVELGSSDETETWRAQWHGVTVTIRRHLSESAKGTIEIEIRDRDGETTSWCTRPGGPRP